MPANKNWILSLVLTSAVTLLSGAMLSDILSRDETRRPRTPTKVLQTHPSPVGPASRSPAVQPQPELRQRGVPPLERELPRTEPSATPDRPEGMSLRASLLQKLTRPGTYSDERGLTDAFERAAKSFEAAVSVQGTDYRKPLLLFSSERADNLRQYQ